MRDLRKLGVACASALLLAGCGATGPAPVTAEFAKRAGGSEPELRTGRALFVARCIECHALPDPRKYRREEWPQLVEKMSGRAGLTPVERDAIVGYVQARAVVPQ